MISRGGPPRGPQHAEQRREDAEGARMLARGVARRLRRAPRTGSPAAAWPRSVGRLAEGGLQPRGECLVQLGRELFYCRDYAIEHLIGALGPKVRPWPRNTHTRSSAQVRRTPGASCPARLNFDEHERAVPLASPSLTLRALKASRLAADQLGFGERVGAAAPASQPASRQRVDDLPQIGSHRAGRRVAVVRLAASMRPSTASTARGTPGCSPRAPTGAAAQLGPQDLVDRGAVKRRMARLSNSMQPAESTALVDGVDAERRPPRARHKPGGIGHELA